MTAWNLDMPHHVTSKKYRCAYCGAESMESTNHYGEIYSRCNACAWKRPGQAHRKECIEEKPEGAWVPEPWTLVRLGDIADID
jgi:DNA-directed RNA polymerase subunit RPC12/RpoP